MKLLKQVGISIVLVTITVMILCSGCSSQKTSPPLFISSPPQQLPDELYLLNIPNAPEPVSFPLKINIPQQDVSVSKENSVMQLGVTVKPGSSVIINVPEYYNQPSEEQRGTPLSDNMEFRTADYFSILEQYIERGLISIGLNVKDRSKFEAKLRDLRDSGKDDSYTMALADLQKELDAGKLSRAEFAEEAKQLRDKLLDASGRMLA